MYIVHIFNGLPRSGGISSLLTAREGRVIPCGGPKNSFSPEEPSVELT